MNNDEEQRILSPQTEQTHRVVLEQHLQAVHAQLAQIQQDVVRIQQTQLAHAETLHKLERSAARGRRMRRVGLLIRLAIVFAIIAAILYFLMDWDALLYMVA
jgi:hypothetical protein